VIKVQLIGSQDQLIFPYGTSFYLTDHDLLIIENIDGDDIGAVSQWSSVQIDSSDGRESSTGQ
jgi:hypothetical protein